MQSASYRNVLYSKDSHSFEAVIAAGDAQTSPRNPGLGPHHVPVEATVVRMWWAKFCIRGSVYFIYFY